MRIPTPSYTVEGGYDMYRCVTKGGPRPNIVFHSVLNPKTRCPGGVAYYDYTRQLVWYRNTGETTKAGTFIMRPDPPRTLRQRFGDLFRRAPMWWEKTLKS